jgi:hypothetical protein
MRNFFDEITDIALSKTYVDQGSEAWDAVRVGRATSSEWHKLTGMGTRDMTPEELKARPKSGKGSKTTKVPDPTKLSDAAQTYIRQKVYEVRTGTAKPQPYAFALGYGKEHEPDAVEEFERITGFTCEKTGFQVYTDHAGGSPDRLIVEDGKVVAGLEVKCPVFEKQIDYEMLTSMWDLKAMFPEYYWQCVSLMLFHDLPKWYFATWGGLLPEGERMKEKNIIVLESKYELIQEDQELIGKQLKAFVEEKLKLLKLLA